MADEEKQATIENAELKSSVKKGMGLVVFAVIMTVLALGAGVYIVIDKTTDEKRINDAVSSKCVSKSDDNNSQIQPIDNNNVPCGSNTDIADNTTTANASDYVYVEEWGVRIKKPAGYYVWYRYEPNTGSAVMGKLVLSASPTYAQTWQNFGDFDGGHGLLYIYRRDANTTQWEAGGSNPTYIGSYNGYNYFYSGPQACSSHLAEYGGDVCQREENIFNTLRDSMTSLDNWSTF